MVFCYFDTFVVLNVSVVSNNNVYREKINASHVVGMIVECMISYPDYFFSGGQYNITSRA